tara:strand:- start:2052 stop:2165 length:114 start_codon:yes stop_codon:yes gene_type:complete
MAYNLLEMNKNLSDLGINFSDLEIFLVEIVYRLFFDF